ncbi:MAG: hypothetical protein Q9227_002930 [Pyrenula ochraceoflavens]
MPSDADRLAAQKKGMKHKRPSSHGYGNILRPQKHANRLAESLFDVDPVPSSPSQDAAGLLRDKASALQKTARALYNITQTLWDYGKPDANGIYDTIIVDSPRHPLVRPVAMTASTVKEHKASTEASSDTSEQSGSDPLAEDDESSTSVPKIKEHGILIKMPHGRLIWKLPEDLREKSAAKDDSVDGEDLRRRRRSYRNNFPILMPRYKELRAAVVKHPFPRAKSKGQ